MQVVTVVHSRKLIEKSRVKVQSSTYPVGYLGYREKKYTTEQFNEFFRNVKSLLDNRERK